MLEAEIKLAIIDRLYTSGKLGDGDVVASELKVAGGARRADLVLANGKLHAFEVKSDADNLDRLSAQLTVYLEHFDKVTVVSGGKHLDRVLELAPSCVEVLRIAKTNGQYAWKLARRGRVEHIVDAKRLLAFLPIKEAVRRLREAGVACPTKVSRSEIESIATQASITKLRSVVINHIKDRHRDANRKFLKSRLSSMERRVALLSVTPKVPEEPSYDAFLNGDLVAGVTNHVKHMPGALRVNTGESEAPLYVLPRALHVAQSSSSS